MGATLGYKVFGLDDGFGIVWMVLGTLNLRMKGRICSARHFWLSTWHLTCHSEREKKGSKKVMIPKQDRLYSLAM